MNLIPNLGMNAKNPGEPPPDPQFWGSRTWIGFHVPPELGARGPKALQ